MKHCEVHCAIAVQCNTVHWGKVEWNSGQNTDMGYSVLSFGTGEFNTSSKIPYSAEGVSEGDCIAPGSDLSAHSEQSTEIGEYSLVRGFYICSNPSCV